MAHVEVRSCPRRRGTTGAPVRVFYDTNRVLQWELWDAMIQIGTTDAYSRSELGETMNDTNRVLHSTKKLALARNQTGDRNEG